jgi:hypothetical protein
MSARFQTSAAVGDDLGARALVLVVGDAGPEAGPGLHDHLVAVVHQRLDAPGHQADAVLVVLDLSDGAYEHIAD